MSLGQIIRVNCIFPSCEFDCPIAGSRKTKYGSRIVVRPELLHSFVGAPNTYSTYLKGNIQMLFSFTTRHQFHLRPIKFRLLSLERAADRFRRQIHNKNHETHIETE